MDENGRLPELLRLLYAEHAALAAENTGERLLRWAGGFDDWLASLEKSRGAAARRVARTAWGGFLAFYQGMPWNVLPDDIERWQENLEQRGLSSNTINDKVRSLRDFYQHCLQAGLDPESPPGFNPACLPPRPSRPHYQDLIYMSSEEAQALLAAVDRDRSLVGKRDYALLLLALRTGLESGQIRAIRWGDLILEGDAALLKLPEPKKSTKNASVQSVCSPSNSRLPQDAWAAILDYLQASGRLPGMHTDMYVFAPLADPLSGVPTGKPEEWNAGRPLAVDQASHLLKQYARWAGLDETRVTWHCLRHTAAVLRLQAGDSLEEIQRSLGKTGRESMLAFMRQYTRQPKVPLWRSPDEKSAGSLARRSKGGQKGSQNRLETGFYAGRRPPGDQPASPGMQLQNTLSNMQSILDRTLGMVDGTETMGDMLRLADIYTKVAGRMLSINKAQGGLKDLSAAFKDYFDRILDQALSEIGNEIDNGTFPSSDPQSGPQDEELLAAFSRLVRVLLDNPDKLDELYRKNQ